MWLSRLIEVAAHPGKAVFSEKPIALDLAETTRVVKVVRERLELESFFRALLEGKEPTPGPEDALETLRLALAATKSWRENRPVKVSEIQP